ncbi:MAG: phosphoglycerate dehydrogenase [Planctomycetes bacterium]|nr:phosphoglycerate dehydrogenase [Planctomycetota bacterium]
MPRILIADAMAEEGIARLRGAAGFEVEVKTGQPAESLIEMLPRFDGLVVRSATPVTAPLIDAGRNLRVIGRAGVGVDNIDVPAATRRGIVVMNAPLGNILSAAEHTFAMLLAAARNIARADRALRGGKWEKKACVGVELRGKTLGIVGLGRVGAEVAGFARAFGMKIVAYDPFLTPERAQELGVTRVELDPLCAAADFITIHSPLNEKTERLFNAARFACCKPGVRVVNCARGGIIVEEDLAAALRSGTVAAAALDVFAQEPLGTSPLSSLETATLTPHLGASTEEAQVRVATDIADQFIEFFTTGSARNAVNIVSLRNPKLAPYVGLAETLGAVNGQLAEGAMRTIEVRCYGDIAVSDDARLLTVAAVKGALAPICQAPVNLVNAELTARDRGIRIVESRSRDVRNFTNVLSVAIQTDSGRRLAAGTVFEDREARIIKIDAFDVDVRPAANMLIMYYPDIPGMVGKFGTILGRNRINIARMEVGRSAPGQQAVVVLTLDDVVPAPVCEELRREAGIDVLKAVRL